jgi:hypothetical protein
MRALDRFNEIHARIKFQGDYGCKNRAHLLVDDLRDEHIMDAAAYVIRAAVHFEDGTRQKLLPLPYRRSIAWDEHIVCMAGDVVYDPVLPQPFPLEEYLAQMFGNVPVLLAPENTNKG